MRFLLSFGECQLIFISRTVRSPNTSETALHRHRELFPLSAAYLPETSEIDPNCMTLALATARATNG